MNKVSDNVAARHLMLSLSPGFPGRPATLAGAQKAVGLWLRDQGLAEGDVEVENGSGLSHSERAKRRAMVQLLRKAWRAEQEQAFFKSPPITAAPRWRCSASGRRRTGDLIRLRSAVNSVQACGCSSMVERQLPKLHTGVRFPSPAPRFTGRQKFQSDSWAVVSG